MENTIKIQRTKRELTTDVFAIASLILNLLVGAEATIEFGNEKCVYRRLQ